MASQTSSAGYNRRGFLAGALATAVALPLINACTPAGPGGPAAGGGGPVATAGAQSAAKNLFPTYIASKSGPKPDYHDDNPLFSDAFENYPKNPQKANDSTPPGSGGTINVLTAAYFPPPTARDQNPTWQA